MVWERKHTEPIIKSESVTGAEDFLRGLCTNTFLSFWSWPNVFRNQGKRNDGDGKELCDLLIVFGEHVMIFSDKYCKFPKNKDEQISWKRWFRRTVENSAQQTWGAERWIKEHPDRIFIDKKCKTRLPLDLPPTEKMKFHLIVVAHGVSSQIEKVLGESGSLMIDSTLKGINSHVKPFTIGDLDPLKSFVHVLDDYSLLTLMKTRDTVTDFIDYLKKKEDLIRKRPYKFFTTGEEELLGVYLTHVDEKGQHDFVFPVKDSAGPPDAIFLGPGPWENFLKSDAHKKQIEANHISYMWDYLIERFSKHALEGTQHHVSEGGIKDTEKIIRFMASEPRYERRALSMSLQDMFETTSANQRRLRVHHANSRNSEQPCYIFLLFPLSKDQKIPLERYREVRMDFLYACCLVARKEYPQIRNIVGVATESGMDEFRSEDACYVDGSHWNDKLEQEATQLQKEWKILVKPEPIHVHVAEYPGISKKEKHSRNDLCPCDSGKKYKKCCIDKKIRHW